MSTLETIINPKQRKAKKGAKSAQADAIYQALDSMETHVLPLSALVQSELNVRKRPIDEKALSELADSIQAVGVLQNLVVYPMDNDVYGVAAGQRRLLALQQLVTKGHLASSFPVPVKVVSESDALIISLTENSQREAMHPADQLHAFIELQKTGKNASEIGDLLGFSTHHVKKCLRLANMAPELLAELDADNITLDQLQALAGTPDHDRQVMVWNNAMGWKKEPRYLREAVEETKTPVENNRLVKFVGLDAYEQAGGTLEIDLFTEAGFIENAPLLEKLALDKLTVCADLLADIEGWQYGIARLERPSFYGNDAETLSLSHAPEAVIPPEFADLLAELRVRETDLRQQSWETDDENEQADLCQAVADCEKQIEGIKARTKNQAWTADGKATKGVVVFLDRDGEPCVIRGVIDLAQQEPQCSEAESETESVSEQSTTQVETTKPEKALQQGMALAQESKVFFSRIDAIAKALPLHNSLDSQSLGKAFDRLVAQKAIIPVTSGKGAAQQHYVTASTWEMEKQILTTILAGKDTQTPLMASVPEGQLNGLTSGQKAATELILGSRDQFVGIQGYAGVGKTTQFTAVLKALETLPAAQRPEVIGLAPTHRAVGEMAAVGVKAQTLHAFLMDANQRQQQGETLDFKNTLFLVDESSMIGNRNLSEVLQIIAQGGGRGVLSGDTAQLLSVDSGTPFALAQDRSALDTAIMKEIVRQNPELRPAIEAIIAGQVQTAIDTMNSVTPDVVPRRAGAKLPEQSVVDSGNKVITHILDDYRSRTPEAQKETLIVVQTNSDKDVINRGIHEILIEQGQLQGGKAVPILVRENTRTEALLSTAGMAEHAGKIALIQEQYYRIAVTEEGISDGVVTLVDEEGKGHLLSAFESSLRDIGIYRQEGRHIAIGEKITFTRTDKERGRVTNSDWTVSEVNEHGQITLTNGEESRVLDPNGALTDQHLDYGYAGTAHKAQGASSPYVIVLGGVQLGRRMLATLRDAYVALSRTKAHVQTYSDDLDKWTSKITNPGNRKTAHDVLLAEQDYAAKVGNQLFGHANPLNDTAIGRALSRQMGLGESHEGKFVYPSTKHPEPHVAWPAFDEHGKAQGTVLQAIELEGDKLQGLRAEGRLLGSEQAQFIVVKPSQNGQTVIVNSLESAFETMAQQPEQGVVVQLNPDERLHTAMIEKITEGEVDNAYSNQNTAQTNKADSDPKNLQTPEEQAIDKALKEAEAALRQQANSESKVPELNEDELRQVMAQERDSLLKGEHDLMEAKERVIEKAVQLEREHQQQQRDVLRQQEREIVMEKSRDREFGD
ncbi:AAA family ATPase [Providencia rettgeri]|uniref:AAA family ATPase n=1 Tax=Providencia rettgeri TaxID=587 RepID=UPI0030164CF7